ncbi:hypothetical protein chiPu_0030825, partial [Chiloscyllium punctatum]|nr:hypothetical protein [Chiloscyllium punctatum]
SEASTAREQIKNESGEIPQNLATKFCSRTGCFEYDKVITRPEFPEPFQPAKPQIMLSVIIPTDGIERTAVATLAALVPGAAAGVIREVLLVDRTNTDIMERVADVAGCRFLRFEGTRAAALAAGARQARSPWLMFLHPGAVLDAGWIEETTQFIQMVAASGKDRAGIFRYARAPYSDPGLRDGLKFVARMITGPSAEQGLLIAREHYERIGGYRPDARRSEARLLRRLGRSSRT